jgi:hypothetical protein
MRIVEQKIYRFSELSEKVKQKVIEASKNFESEVYNSDFLLDEFKQELASNGFTDAKIAYSGFYSQGDGLSFDANVNLIFFINQYKDQLPLLHKILHSERDLYSYIDAGICKNSYSNHYSHRKTRYAEVSFNYLDSRIESVLTKEVIDLNDTIESDRLDFCDKFYKILKDDYEERLEDSNIIDSLVTGEYEFTETGEIYND